MEERTRILNLLQSGQINVEEAALLLDKLEKKNDNLKNQYFDFEERVKVFGVELGNFLKETIKTVEEKINAVFPNQNK
jgi:hypothetical protein